MITYEQWNQAIVDYCFEDRDKDEIIFLHITPEVLHNIASQFDFVCDDVVESLAQAVRSKLIYSNNVRLWEIDSTTLTNQSAKYPPQVAFLALTVLAASQMDRDRDGLENISSANYYVRLNELLFREFQKGSPEGWDNHKFERLWNSLQDWAEEKHDIELYLSKGSINRQYVWYPISQCLLNRRAQRTIYHFFQDIKLKPASFITNDKLISDLRSWMSSTTFSARIRKYIYDDTPYTKLLLRQIQSLLRNWDGELEPDSSFGIRHNHIKIDIQLRFDRFGDVQVCYWFRRKGKSRIDLCPNPFGINTLQPLDDTWFEPVVSENPFSLWYLQDPIELKTAESKPLIYTLKPSDILVFRREPNRDDGWLNQCNLQLHASHLIVFHEWLEEEVISFLQQVCAQQVEKKEPILVNGKETGWLYLQDIKPNKFLSAPPDLSGLSVTISDRISFVDGLSTKDQFNHIAYLDICLPAILVPNLGLYEDEFFYLENCQISVPPDRKIDLCGLNPGVYRLTYGDKRRKLRVISPNRSLKHEKQTLVLELNQDVKGLTSFVDRDISEIKSQSGLWLAGAKFFGQDVPQTTWDEVKREPQITQGKSDRVAKSPAELISSVVRVAIELKQDQTSVPEWLNEVMERLSKNIALRSLIEKRLRRCYKQSLSFTELLKLVK